MNLEHCVSGSFLKMTSLVWTLLGIGYLFFANGRFYSKQYVAVFRIVHNLIQSFTFSYKDSVVNDEKIDEPRQKLSIIKTS